VKSDLDSQQSSVNDMLAQIKKIMSQEQVKNQNDEQEYSNIDDILELSEDSIVKDIKQVSRELDIALEPVVSSVSNDSFNKMDSLITSSDLLANKAEDKIHIEKDLKVNEKTKDTFVQKDDKSLASVQEINDNSETRVNEQKIETSAKSNLISDNVVKETTQAIKEFIEVIDRPINDGLKFRNGSTVEDLVVEIMKPQISDWLNANLSTIVKKVVEKEVRKLIPREED